MGTRVLKSKFHGAARLETGPLVVKELNVVGSRSGPFPRVLALLPSGRVDPRPPISRVFALLRMRRLDAASLAPGSHLRW